ncbi:hypothetical protein BC567DRAFT_237011 [Phyllosticta citribraziliensis]
MPQPVGRILKMAIPLLPTRSQKVAGAGSATDQRLILASRLVQMKSVQRQVLKEGRESQSQADQRLAWMECQSSLVQRLVEKVGQMQAWWRIQKSIQLLVQTARPLEHCCQMRFVQMQWRTMPSSTKDWKQLVVAAGPGSVMSAKPRLPM